MANPDSQGPTKRQMRRQRMLHEKHYLDAVRRVVDPDDISDIVEMIIRDAKDIENPRICNEARRWIGTFLLKGGKMSLDEIDAPPVVRS